jgi:hypothetical protein
MAPIVPGRRHSVSICTFVLVKRENLGFAWQYLKRRAFPALMLLVAFFLAAGRKDDVFENFEDNERWENEKRRKQKRLCECV